MPLVIQQVRRFKAEVSCDVEECDSVLDLPKEYDTAAEAKQAAVQAGLAAGWKRLKFSGVEVHRIVVSVDGVEHSQGLQTLKATDTVNTALICNKH